ncbi:phage protein [Gracilibacillus boraciitolerans JCM 21714]|uniref:Phage protein n=1 Tax=Gracilibacillus boraciitolerans JCM 21714 TaxID=1298598 RepID=W4VLP1_9BACI|nr:DUF4352 domain-containing protein [Gracilibacillus boraciitolerans]GAE94071.1 phage protein [Gracilibacillus boraciitolerans JCM 21714]
MKSFFKWAGIIVVGLIVVSVIFGDDEKSESGEVTENKATEAAEGDNQESDDVAEKTDETEDEVTTAGVGDTATIADVAFTVNNVETTTEISTGNEFIEPATTSGQFVMIDVTIKNDKKESITIDSSFFKLIGAEGTEYDPSTDGNVMMNTNPESDFFLTQINPGLEKTGTVVFEVGADFNVADSILQAQTGFWGGTERIEINLK